MTASKYLAFAALAAALALAGCGRKAPLDTPYEAAVEARKQAERNDEPLPPEPEPPVEDRRFILDPLID
ncbi:lipoprotein [Aquibium sp. A9E412]|uniref:LPS translocon maturation chaperone LptM n=1 Tax=Aquibium sp. A9E412 TaxID=2976767 RepID=UPI0025B14B7A|nr:lipoprotein [Aquibium sp. A9E412]MDN2568372.1 lipoprotein [Aquibium sp. A9E412]